MMKIAICEDELSFQQKLQSGVAEFFSEKGVETEFFCFDNGAELIQSLGNGYDVIFLDINLGSREDGMDIAAQLREQSVCAPVIFVTSLENRAIDGYDVGAYGFVVKKNLDEKLHRVLGKLWKEHFCRPTIALQTKDSTEIIELNSIVSAQSQGRCSLIKTDTAELEDARSIGRFAELLGDEFVEAHKSVFVNISKIKRINNDTVSMCDESIVPLSRRNRKNVMCAVMKRIGGK